MAANMWENSLKNVESDNNKILYETLLDCFLQRNGTYFLNKLRIYIYTDVQSSALSEGRGRDSTVTTGTRYGLDGPGI